MNDKIVSSEKERLILVDDADNILGYETKGACHDGDGILHRAFSLFIFNPKGDLLLQQRAASKRLWPLIWSNSCCSHPREGESYSFSIKRRLREELGLDTSLKFLYRFQYQVRYGEAGSENELCSVYIGCTAAMPVVNKTEIADSKYISIPVLEREMKQAPEKFSPWFKMEWNEIRSHYMDDVKACQKK